MALWDSVMSYEHWLPKEKVEVVKWRALANYQTLGDIFSKDKELGGVRRPPLCRHIKSTDYSLFHRIA